MFKKSIMMLAVVAIIATLVMVPVASSAAVLTDVYFEVDFGSESVDDLAGNYTYQDLESAVSASELVFDYDDVVGQNVLVLEGDGVLTWRSNDGTSLNQYDLAEGLTMEAYVYISTDPIEFQQHMIIIEANDTGLHFQEYNANGDISAGFRAGDNSAPGVWDMANAYVATTFPHMEWIHLVGVSDGLENRMFINGELVASQKRTQTILMSQFNQGDNGIYVGESMLGNMWGETAFYGKMAFVKIYKEAATNEQVAEMYAEATGKAAPDVVPTAVPTEAPATEVPADGATAAPTQAPTVDNTPTFDLGLVSLAAVALSSVVAVKKRK